MVLQVGLMVVSMLYIKFFWVEMIKFYSGLVRSINLCYENQLFVESLIGVCVGIYVKVFVVEVFIC